MEPRTPTERIAQAGDLALVAEFLASDAEVTSKIVSEQHAARAYKPPDNYEQAMIPYERDQPFHH